MLKEEAGRTAISLPPHLLGYAAAIIDMTSFRLNQINDTPYFSMSIFGTGFSLGQHKFLEYYFGIRYQTREGNASYKFMICGKENIYTICSILMPYLIDKKNQAAILIEYTETLNNHGGLNMVSEEMIQKRKELAAKMRVENNKERKYLGRGKFKKGHTYSQEPRNKSEEDILGSLF